MIAAIDSPEHTLHSHGFVSAVRDFSNACKFDPAPSIKRKMILIVAGNYYMASKLAFDKGLAPNQWKWIVDELAVKGLIDAVVWLGPKYMSLKNYYDIRREVSIRGFEVIDMSVVK